MKLRCEKENRKKRNSVSQSTIMKEKKERKKERQRSANYVRCEPYKQISRARIQMTVFSHNLEHTDDNRMRVQKKSVCATFFFFLSQINMISMISICLDGDVVVSGGTFKLQQSLPSC